jgi:hypothetical protein
MVGGKRRKTNTKEKSGTDTSNPNNTSNLQGKKKSKEMHTVATNKSTAGRKSRIDAQGARQIQLKWTEKSYSH